MVQARDAAAFARAALRALALEQPRLTPRGPVRLLGGSVSGAYVFARARTRAGAVFAKIAVDPRVTLESEAHALDRLGAPVAPRLLAHATGRELVTLAASAGEWSDVQTLDNPNGGVLVTVESPGQPLGSPLQPAQLPALADSIAALHRRPHRGLEELALPSHPRSLMSLLVAYDHEIRRIRLLDTASRARVREAVRGARSQLERQMGIRKWSDVRRACHGDLRLHKLLWHRGRVQIVDFEHAGWGDPALELAMLVTRVPLDDDEELQLVYAYALAAKNASNDPTFLHRYFTLRPLVGLCGALGGLLDLNDVSRGERTVRDPIRTHIRRWLPKAVVELEDAIARVGGRSGSAPKLRWTKPQKRPRRSAITVTVDGTAASLKSPLAAALASRLGLPYYDTGAAYRYAAWWAWRHDLDSESAGDRRRLVKHLRQARPKLASDGSIQVQKRRFRMSLELAEVETQVAHWAVHPEVRDAIGLVVRGALRGAAVVEGRDVGTELLPRARLKVFVDAPLVARAAWLHARLGVSPAQARKWIRDRDAKDKQRELGPLRAAPGAHRVIVVPATVEAVADRLAARVRR